MDISDLHDVRDGAAPRRHRSFNPFIHLSPDSPLMRVLFSITRPAQRHAKLAAPARPVRKRIFKKSHSPRAAMVSYTGERHEPHKPQPMPKR